MVHAVQENHYVCTVHFREINFDADDNSGRCCSKNMLPSFAPGTRFHAYFTIDAR